MIDNLYFFSSDGGPVVYSKINGLAGKLSKKFPHIRSIHCVAYRSALGIK